MANALDRMLALLRRPAEAPLALDTLSPAAFRAVVDERLGNLERQLDELKTRINGLLFLIAGTVVTQVLVRLLA
jgi:hypothetical protein